MARAAQSLVVMRESVFGALLYPPRTPASAKSVQSSAGILKVGIVLRAWSLSKAYRSSVSDKIVLFRRVPLRRQGRRFKACTAHQAYLSRGE